MSTTYTERRGELETYYDRTAVEHWKRLTSDAPVSRIRATVRAGRNTMRDTFLDWLPADLVGRRVLDAGCGTCALAVEMARRGATVVAVDISPTLVELGRERAPKDLAPGSIDFKVGDMQSAEFGEFDHIVAMDSLIHYPLADVVAVASSLMARTRASLVMTFAPRTPALTVMHAVGRLLPKGGDRAPAIEPVGEAALTRALSALGMTAGWRVGRTLRVQSGFYTSPALELKR
jgi:magnesium-protoporphyrin O-methyltransferase